MAIPVVTALITAAVSLLLAVGKILWDVREKGRDRQLAAREQLDRYRAPLLAAADDLGRRINNIRTDKFFAYLAKDSRRELALSNTLFRFAQYFAWVEIFYGRILRPLAFRKRPGDPSPQLRRQATLPGHSPQTSSTEKVRTTSPHQASCCGGRSSEPSAR
jgi:hypothetical protein